MAPRFHVENFGCRAARADGEAVADRLVTSGCQPAPVQAADVVVVNTCSVTAEADRSARAFIRRARRLNPQARIVVTGCYAQRAPHELAQIDGVAAVVGNSHKALAPQLILGLLNGSAQTADGPRPLVQIQPTILADDTFAHSFFDDAPLRFHPPQVASNAPQAPLAPPQVAQVAQTRPNLKIQEGCSNHCTFCVIPETRGPSRSLPMHSVFDQVRGFVAAGGNELVLSGINLGRWGFDLPGRPRLSALVRQLLEQTALPRLRLSSIEPMDVDAELLALWGEQKSLRLARHAHLPLQSGSDAVLRRMHRRYRPWHYADKVAALFAACPQMTLGADVMVGFPGETDAEFRETFEFIRQLPFGYLHLFPFSPRPGTPGARLHQDSPVPAQAVQERMAALRALAAQKSAAHRSAFVGQTLPALTLHTPPALTRRNRTLALSDNFLPIHLEGRHAANLLCNANLCGIQDVARDGQILTGQMHPASYFLAGAQPNHVYSPVLY